MLRKTIEITLVAAFSTLCALLTFFTAIPSPTGGYTHIGDSAIYLAALLFGSRVGLLVGIIGPVVADMIVGYPRWYVTLVAHGLQGYIAGFGRKKGTLWQAILLFTAGLVMSLTYFAVNVFIKGFALAILSFIRDFFGQTLVSVIIAIPVAKAVEKSGVISRLEK